MKEVHGRDEVGDWGQSDNATASEHDKISQVIEVYKRQHVHRLGTPVR